MPSHQTSQGAAGDDVLHVVRGGAFGFGGNDTIIATAQDDLTQIHTYAAGGDDLTRLDFAPIAGFAHGHHVRGGSGEDVFDFTNIGNVSGLVVGRIEDFDIRSDRIMVEGQAIDLSDLPDFIRIVAYNGHHDDPGAEPQPWLHIATQAGGDIFYALEGARIDMDSADAQEPHFLRAPVDPRTLPEIAYVSPDNYLPDDAGPVSGLVIEDTDVARADVLAPILGSDLDDLIAAGLNDDTVHAGAGHDTIWAGSGNDVVFGGAGDDGIFGGTGNDYIDGGAGRDDLTGGAGEDLFVFADFERGFDVIRDFVPGTDQIVIDHEDMGSMKDLRLIKFDFEDTPSTLVRFVGQNGEIDMSKGGIILKGVLKGEMSNTDFIFDEVMPPEPGAGAAHAPIVGTRGVDALQGTDGADHMSGLGGRDQIEGGNGDDLLDGGFGRDTLTGGAGEDLFVYADFDRGFDVIRDFVPGTDQIVIDHRDLETFDDLRLIRYNFENTPSTLVRFLGPNGSVDKSKGGIVLKGVLREEVSEDDFLFDDPQALWDERQAAEDPIDDPMVHGDGHDHAAEDLMQALFLPPDGGGMTAGGGSGMSDDDEDGEGGDPLHLG